MLSNIAVLSRLGLLCETLRHFLKTLAAEHPRLYGRVPKRLRERYLKEDGSATAYQDAPSGTGKRRLPVCARDLYRLHQLCAGTAAEGLESYALLQRLLAEQCEVTADKQRPSAVDDDAGEGGVPVVPSLTTGGTDAKHICPRRPGAQVYGFMPYRQQPGLEEMQLIHGNDERTTVETCCSRPGDLRYRRGVCCVSVVWGQRIKPEYARRRVDNQSGPVRPTSVVSPNLLPGVGPYMESPTTTARNPL